MAKLPNLVPLISFGVAVMCVQVCLWCARLSDNMLLLPTYQAYYTFEASIRLGTEQFSKESYWLAIYLTRFVEIVSHLGEPVTPPRYKRPPRLGCEQYFTDVGR